MLHITIEGTSAHIVTVSNKVFTRKSISYAEALALTKGIFPVKIIKEQSERLGIRVIKCYDIEARCSLDIIKDLIELEKSIMEVFGTHSHVSLADIEDVSDAYQEALELQWEKRDISDKYEKLQKELLVLKPTWRAGKIRTAQEYYNKQKELEADVRYYKKNHINGF